MSWRILHQQDQKQLMKSNKKVLQTKFFASLRHAIY